MERYTVEQRIFIVKTHYKNGENFTQTIRRLREHFGRHNRPSRTGVQNLIKKFEETGSVKNLETPVRLRSARSVENIDAVTGSVNENPGTSIRHRSQQLDITRSSMQRILTKDLHLHAYKVQLTQELKPRDHLQRLTFANWILDKKENDADFRNKIIFSDEAHFHLGGFVNKQNCRIWGHENPRVIHEKPMHPQKATVWCGFHAGGVIGPYFFENAAGNAVTVNGESYREMITNFLWHELDGIDLENVWFQQDGATCHTANDTMVLLRDKFPGRIISRNGDVNWPPRSCDLTPPDFFLWSYLKDRVYANDPQTIPQLKDNIRRVTGEIGPNLCENVVRNFDKRIVCCQRSRGGHLADIIFHV